MRCSTSKREVSEQIEAVKMRGSHFSCQAPHQLASLGNLYLVASPLLVLQCMRACSQANNCDTWLFVLIVCIVFVVCIALLYLLIVAGKFSRLVMRVRKIAQGTAESNSSFLSALQTSQEHHNSTAAYFFPLFLAPIHAFALIN